LLELFPDIRQFLLFLGFVFANLAHGVFAMAGIEERPREMFARRPA